MTVYSTGTVTVSDGSTTVTGNLTDWDTAMLTAGATFYVGTFSSPIAAIVSDTELTLELPFVGTTGSGKSYRISRVDAFAQQTALNAEKIAALLAVMPVHSVLGKYLAQAADDVDGRQLLGLGAAAMSFEFDGGSTTMADPSAGYFRANNATAASATALAISATDQDGNDLSEFFLSRLSSTSTPKAHLAITYGAERIEFAVTAVTDNGSWLQLTVQEGLDTDALADEDMGAFTFWSAGNKGDDGSTPAEVAALLEPLLLAEGLPTRLGSGGQDISNGDWNTATTNGWYRGHSCANAPNGSANWFAVFVENTSATGTYITQTAHTFAADSSTDTAMYRRSCNNSVWTSWYRCRIAEAELDARYVTLGTTQTIPGTKIFSGGVYFGPQGAEGGQFELQKGTGQTNFDGNVIFDTLADVVRIFTNVSAVHKNFQFNLVTGALTSTAGGTFLHTNNVYNIANADVTAATETTRGFVSPAQLKLAAETHGHKLSSYTVGTVPSAASKGAGYEIYVSNETGGAIPAFSDGANWRRCTDRAIIS